MMTAAHCGDPRHNDKKQSGGINSPYVASNYDFDLARKSVSVHGTSVTTPLLSVMWASASDSGAGPRTTLPVWSYWDPWQGHMYLFAALFHGTTQPKCVQTALMP